MQISDAGVELIKSFEGFRSEAYLDIAGIPTIGYGTTHYPNGAKVEMGNTCDKEQATFWLFHDLQRFVERVNYYFTGINLTQNQFDALCSFVYNLGPGVIADSTLYSKIKVDPNDKTIKTEFTKWVNAGGKPSKGLLNRRKKEAELYFK